MVATLLLNKSFVSRRFCYSSESFVEVEEVVGISYKLTSNKPLAFEQTPDLTRPAIRDMKSADTPSTLSQQ